MTSLATQDAKPGSDTEREAWARAVESRDARFDGWVYVGVTSTGIYCRPSCPTPVRPKRRNMTFWATPAAAQAAGFRACKRCAPDATPGSPEWNRRDDLVARAVRSIDDGAVDRLGVAGLADELGVSARHLHRLLDAEIGAGPLALARARRARTARSLIESTDLAFSEIAFASGFESIRQFNDTIRQVFDRTPTEIRNRGRRGERSADGGAIELRLPTRAPFDAQRLLAWFAVHAIDGVEEVADGTYRRSVHLPGGPAVIELEPGDGEVRARFHLSAISDLPQALQRSRRLLDLDADPTLISETLATDPPMAALVARRPGLRSPGELSPFDGAIRAVLHQQVSLASARGMASRLAAAHGTPLAVPVGRVTTVLPTPERWAELDPGDLGLTTSRARALVGLAAAVADGRIDLEPHTDRDRAAAALLALPGIGPWTVGVIRLRCLADPDVFAAGDLALQRALAALDLPASPAGAATVAESWRPWRSYAMHHLWAHYLEEVTS